MRIQIITRANGYGLSKDIQVLREALTGHEIAFTPWDRPLRHLKDRFHFNIHLELVNPMQFASGRVNILVPNPEWFNPQWTSHLRNFDMVLAKTQDTHRIFSGIHKDVRFTGWTTPDVTGTVDYDNPSAVHVAGESTSKGTEQVIAAARMFPELHVDVVVRRKMNDVPDNVTIHTTATDEQLAQLRTAPIHIQPSTYEGFGHVINEGRAMGAVVITTGASPMDELVDASYAISAPSCTVRTMRLAQEKLVCPDSLADCMRLAASTVKEGGPVWGKRARQAYEQQREEFTKRINEIIQ